MGMSLRPHTLVLKGVRTQVTVRAQISMSRLMTVERSRPFARKYSARWLRCCGRTRIGGRTQEQIGLPLWKSSAPGGRDVADAATLTGNPTARHVQILPFSHFSNHNHHHRRLLRPRRNQQRHKCQKYHCYHSGSIHSYDFVGFGYYQ